MPSTWGICSMLALRGAHGTLRWVSEERKDDDISLIKGHSEAQGASDALRHRESSGRPHSGTHRGYTAMTTQKKKNNASSYGLRIARCRFAVDLPCIRLRVCSWYVYSGATCPILQDGDAIWPVHVLCHSKSALPLL